MRCPRVSAAPDGWMLRVIRAVKLPRRTDVQLSPAESLPSAPTAPTGRRILCARRVQQLLIAHRAVPQLVAGLICAPRLEPVLGVGVVSTSTGGAKAPGWEPTLYCLLADGFARTRRIWWALLRLVNVA